MEKIAIIVAAGSGVRMGTATPKQFLTIADKPIIEYTIKAFYDAFPDISVILVLPAAFLTKGAQIAATFHPERPIQVIPGGHTRFESVKNGLAFVRDEAVVFVHDGVRCLVSPALIQRCYQQALEYGNAVPVIEATDSLRILDKETNRALDRSRVRVIQTPQTFRSDILRTAFAQPYQDSFTDEASVVEATGLPVHLIEGESDNIKITKPLDLRVAKIYLEEKAHFNPEHSSH